MVCLYRQGNQPCRLSRIRGYLVRGKNGAAFNFCLAGRKIKNERNGFSIVPVGFICIRFDAFRESYICILAIANFPAAAAQGSPPGALFHWVARRTFFNPFSLPLL